MIVLRARVSGLRSRRQLDFENLALRHQLDVLQRTSRWRQIRTADRERNRTSSLPRRVGRGRCTPRPPTDPDVRD
jgi:hypothetical protein